MRTIITSSVLLGALVFAQPLESSDNTRTIPGIDITTPTGILHAGTLIVKKSWRAATLSGVIVNLGSRSWEHLSIAIQATDGVGTRFNPSPLSFRNLQAGQSLPFTFEVTGKFDFATLGYSMSYQTGHYEAKYSFEMMAPIASDRLHFSDDMADWTIVPMQSAIGLEIVNKSARVLKLDWNQMAFVDFSGKSHKVATSSTRYIEVNAPKAPVIVPAAASLAESVIPTDYVSLSNNEWILAPILPTCPDCRQLINAEFRLFAILDFSGTQKEYEFRVKIKAVE